MISLVQYFLEMTNMCKMSNLLTFSLFFGVILYVLVYLYMLLYSPDSLHNALWWIISVVVLDLAISVIYYYNLNKKETVEITEDAEHTDDLTMMDDEFFEEKEEAGEAKVETEFLTNEYEKELVNEIVNDVSEFKNETIEILKEVEKEMESENNANVEKKSVKPKKKKPLKKEVLENISEITEQEI